MRPFSPISSSDVRNAGFIGHPPFSDDAAKKIFDFIREDDDFNEMSGSDVQRFIITCYYAMTSYKILYGMKKEE